MVSKKIKALVSVMTVCAIFAGCSANTTNGTTNQGNTTVNSTAQENLTGNITIDGSSTVFPLSQAVAEEFTKINKGVKVPVTGSGSGTGLKKLVSGEINVAGASRKIKDEEIKSAKDKGIDIVEIKVAIDGIAVVVNKNNPVNEIKTEELNKIWNKNATAKNWNEINPSWPNEPLKLFSPGAASGTFEYFTEHVNKKAKEQRTDGVQTSEDDNVLVTGVSGDKGAMGYFGYSYYEENQDKLKALKIDGVEANLDNIVSAKYPLSRPLFIYVNKKVLETDPAVKAFVKFYLENASKLAKEIDIIPQNDDVYTKQLEDLKLK